MTTILISSDLINRTYLRLVVDLKGLKWAQRRDLLPNWIQPEAICFGGKKSNYKDAIKTIIFLNDAVFNIQIFEKLLSLLVSLE